MEELKCSTSNCEHNVAGRCSAGVVHISESAVCRTKMKRDGGILAQNFSDLEAAEEFSIEKPDFSNLVECKADCVYNKNEICTAQEILVSDSMIRTKCFTRKTKKAER